MKLFSAFAVFAVLGVAAIVLAESSSTSEPRLKPNSATGGVTRYEIHGEGNDRMMLDRITGQTWVLKTVLRAPTEADPAPIVVWFPVPKADNKLSESILQSRISQLKQFADMDIEHSRAHLAEREKEYGSDHPEVIGLKAELKVFSEGRCA